MFHCQEVSILVEAAKQIGLVMFPENCAIKNDDVILIMSERLLCVAGL